MKRTANLLSPQANACLSRDRGASFSKIVVTALAVGGGLSGGALLHAENPPNCVLPPLQPGPGTVARVTAT